MHRSLSWHCVAELPPGGHSSNLSGLGVLRVSLILLPWVELTVFGLVLAFTIKGLILQAVLVLLSLGLSSPELLCFF